MNIEQITISDFKGIVSKSFIPAKINLMIGPNGTGKTSTLQAVRYGLTGDYPAEAIHRSGEKAEVKLTLHGIGTLTRTLSKAKNETRLNGSLTTQKSINQLFEKQTGASPATMNLLTSSAVVTSLSRGELSEYFIDNNLLSVSLTFEELMKLCKLSEPAQTFLREEFGEGHISMADIEKAWIDAKARRKELKQQLKQAEIKAQDIEETPDIDAESIERELSILLQRKGELHAQRTAYEQTCSKRHQIIDEIEKARAAVGPLIDAPNEEMAAKIEDELRNIEGELNNLRSIVVSIVERGKRLRGILHELSISTCPISKDLVCTTDKTVVQSEMEKEIARAASEYRAQNNRINLLTEKSNCLRKTHNELANQKSKYQDQKLLLEKINCMESNLPEETEPPDEKQIDQLSKKIEALNCKRALVIRQLKTEEYRLLSEELRKKVSIMEEIVREFDPKKGIRKSVLLQSLEPLEEYFNTELKKILPKYSVRLDCDNGFAIKLLKEGIEYDANAAASAGEKCRISFILMDLINALTPFRILIFDSTDSMDAEAIEMFLNMLQAADVQNRYDHIFISMIDHKEVKRKLESFCQIEGVQIIRFGEETDELGTAA